MNFPKHFPWSTYGRRETSAEFESQWRGQCNRASLFPDRPLVSLVVGLPEEGVASLVWEGILQQSYSNWECVVVTSRPLSPGVEGLPPDRRFRLVVAGGTLGERLDAGASAALGRWLAFVEPDSILSPVALYLLLMEARREDAGLVYGNDAFLAPGSKGVAGFFSRPAFSELDLMHFNEVGDFWLMDAGVFRGLQGFGQGERETIYHDLLLRFCERGRSARHLPAYVRYLERTGPDAVSEALQPVVQRWLDRRLPGAHAALEESQGTIRLRIRPPLPGGVRVSAILPFRNRGDWTIRALEALDSQKGVELDIILVDNDSDPAEREKVASRLSACRHAVRMVPHPGPFNFAHLHNRVIAAHARGDYLFFLNNDVFLEGDGVVAEMARWAALPEIGTVGMRLRYPHGGVQHEGIRGAFGGAARLVRIGHFPTEDRFTWESHEVFANTFAASLVRRDLFESLGGLRELDLVNGFGDVAFNFECRKRGLHNFYLGHLEATHVESGSRGPAYEYWEEVTLEREYPEILQQMTREDLAWNRVPGPDISIRTAVKERFLTTLREKAPVLDPVKPHLKKILRGLSKGSHNRAT